MSDYNFFPQLEAIEIDPDYSNRKGYNQNFLGIQVPLPELSNEQLANVSLIRGTDNHVLKYHHFSIVMNNKRKLPFFTAVNIDGVKFNALQDEIPSRKEIGKDRWFIDNRINEEDQISKEFYKGNDFDLGHLVRREDPLWGNSLEDALKGNNDSFHLTNASPQHKDFNQNAERWLGLENYILRNSRNAEQLLKVSVFSGPLFKKNDLEFEYNQIKVKVPGQFWKVITFIKENGQPSSTGYVVSQFDLIDEMLKEEAFAYGQFLTYQRPIHKIEELTGLKFNLSQYDPLLKESENFENEGLTIDTPRLVNRNTDIIL